MKNSRNTIVAFHIGRGGRFNNSGHKTFIGEKRIDAFVDDLFIRNRDEDGRFMTPEYVDFNGDPVGLTQKEADSGIGTINIDHAYDTTYACGISDLDEGEIEIICENDDYKSPELVSFLSEKTAYNFDKYGCVLEEAIEE